MVGFAAYDGTVSGYDDLAMQIRMNDGVGETKGFFDVKNGNLQECLIKVYYDANITYHIEIEANFTAGTYDVWVITPEGDETKIAEDYLFGTSAADSTDDVGQIFIISYRANDVMYIQNLNTSIIN